MTNTKKKKGTPGEAPICEQLDYITSDDKSLAQMLFASIGTGAENAVSRPKGKADRALRYLIADANKNGDCIINVGGGYFRPSEEEEPQLREYLNKELHRIRELQAKVQSMRNAYYGRL